MSYTESVREALAVLADPRPPEQVASGPRLRQLLRTVLAEHVVKLHAVEAVTELHMATSSGLCQTCSSSFPCRTALLVREPGRRRA